MPLIATPDTSAEPPYIPCVYSVLAPSFRARSPSPLKPAAINWRRWSQRRLGSTGARNKEHNDLAQRLAHCRRCTPHATISPVSIGDRGEARRPRHGRTDTTLYCTVGPWVPQAKEDGNLENPCVALFSSQRASPYWAPVYLLTGLPSPYWAAPSGLASLTLNRILPCLRGPAASIEAPCHRGLGSIAARDLRGHPSRHSQGRTGTHSAFPAASVHNAPSKTRKSKGPVEAHPGR